MKHLLTIYKITLSEQRKQDSKQILSDIKGEDLLSVTEAFIRNKLVTQKGVNKSPSEQKVCKIGKDGNGNDQFDRTGRIIEGIIESGEFGQEKEVVDIDDGSTKYTIKKNEAPLTPFYFCFYFPEDVAYGFLVLQKSGNSGIFTLLISLYREYLVNYFPDPYTLSINPFALPWLVDKNLSLISEAKTITLKNTGLHLLDDLGLGILQTEGAMSEVTFRLGKNRFFNIKEWLPEFLNRDESDSTDKILFKDGDVSMEVKMPDGSMRRLNVAQLSSIGTSISLDKDIALNSKGFPKFESISSEARNLINYIESSVIKKAGSKKNAKR